MKKLLLILALFTPILLIGVACLLMYNFKGYLTEGQFVHWDARHYLSIAQIGYSGFKIAFFPLFPALLKILGGKIWTAIVLNGLLFFLAYLLLIRNKSLKLTQHLILLTLPFNLFFFLPFSESVFFMSGTILLIGIEKRNTAFTMLGLFLITLSRPAFLILIPALVLTDMLSLSFRESVANVLKYAIVVCIGLILVGFIQYLDTGEWFKFFDVQNDWGNKLQLPTFPLTTWGGDFVVRLDAVALFTGFFAGVIFLIQIVRSTKVELVKQRAMLISLAYLAGISLLVLFMRGGSLFSLNRFVFATPFFFYMMIKWIQIGIKFSLKELLSIALGLVLFSLLFGSYVHIQTFSLFLVAFSIVFLYFLFKSERKANRESALFLIISIQAILFVVIFYRYLSGGWIA